MEHLLKYNHLLTVLLIITVFKAPLTFSTHKYLRSILTDEYISYLVWRKNGGLLN